MSQSPLIIQTGLRRCHFAKAAKIYDEAFGAKFAIAIPNTDDRLHMLESCFMGEYAFVAVESGELLGLAGYNTTEGALTGGGSLKSLISQLGFFAALRAALVFTVFERTPKAHELVMDGIAVSAKNRGMGIGGQLLDSIINYAADKGYKKLRLDVIDTNPLAKKLYAKKGFKPVHTQYFPYLKRVLGFSASTTMVLTLSE